ncbi:hypothetical protein CLIB1423_05S00496 [[Candida] railenensis]|uniref:Uncharacterized protein n=1 Tax=[Candida] railenensis TaxID=45579 RepID=A0A9P0QNU0_9ASCO|nr:hypothetical protein CLIB1423_05S00496 [[Candida] railenensis]
MEKHELSKLLKKVVYVDDQDSKRSSSAPNAKSSKNNKNKSIITAPVSTNIYPIPPPSKKKSYFLQKIALQEDVTDESEKVVQSNDKDSRFTEQQIDQDLSIVLEQIQQQTVPESPKLEELEIFKFLDSEFLDQ